MSKINTVVLAVVGLKKHPLRLSECGAKPLKNGDQVRVLASQGEKMKEAYAPYLEQVGSPAEVDALKHGHWEPVEISLAAKAAGALMAPPTQGAPKEGDASQAATETDGTEKTEEGKAQNRSMAGRTKTK